VSVITRGRRAAESLMTLTVTAYRPTGLAAQNESTGLEEPQFVSQGTTPGKIQAPGGQSGGDPQAQFVEVAGVKRPIMREGLHIPIDAAIPAAGLPYVADGAWEYVVTAVGVEDDPALIGRRYRVVEVPAKSFATARRLSVVEV